MTHTDNSIPAAQFLCIIGSDCLSFLSDNELSFALVSVDSGNTPGDSGQTPRRSVCH